MKSEQLKLFEEEKITLDDFREFLMRSGEGYGSKRYIKEEWIGKTYVIGIAKGYGREEKEGIIHDSALFEINKEGKGKVTMIDLEKIYLNGNDKDTNFIRKIDRTNAWNKYVIEMRGIKNDEN